ncbi:MAG: hypothetical protein SNJ84_06275, partial [Verrucomicrobiia bacterium]
MQSLVQAAGLLMISLALLHLGFPRFFRWHHTLAPLDLLHRQLFEVHTFFVAFTVGFMGWLSLWHAPELIGTPFGRTVCSGFALFWLIRLLVQWFWFSPKLWRNRPFETGIHLLFTLFWIFLSAVFWA